MKRKYTNLKDKVHLYQHAFGKDINGELLEKIASTFKISAVARIMSKASALSMGFVNIEEEKNACVMCEENTIYVDMSRPVGCSIVLVTASQNFDRCQVQKMFKQHYRYRRNFLRKKDHLHHTKSYYSEMGMRRNVSKFVPRITKSGLYAGIDFDETKYKKIVSNFGRLGHGARQPFARILEALGYSKTKFEHQKDARTKKNSMDLTEAGNGMFTACFHIKMHLDGGDSNTLNDTLRHSGYTCCASCPNNNNNSNSVFLLAEYGLGVNLDCLIAWMFFGAEVVHGTTKPRDLEKSNFKRYDTDFKNAQKVKLDFALVNLAWGVYNRAPPQTIYNRNRQRLAEHNSGLTLTQYFERRVRAGVRNFENRQRNIRLRRR
jgi:hypothetical protein